MGETYGARGEMRHRNNAECGVRNAECQNERRVASDLSLQFRTPHSTFRIQAAAPWHFLNFFPLPQGQGSLRPTPAYGLVTTPAPTGAAWGPTADSPLTRPSAAALLATIGAGRRGAGPLTSPPPGPEPGPPVGLPPA